MPTSHQTPKSTVPGTTCVVLAAPHQVHGTYCQMQGTSNLALVVMEGLLQASQMTAFGNRKELKGAGGRRRRPRRTLAGGAGRE